MDGKGKVLERLKERYGGSMQGISRGTYKEGNKFFPLFSQRGYLFFSQAVKNTVALHLLNFFIAPYALFYRGKIGQKPAKPAMIDIKNI